MTEVLEANGKDSQSPKVIGLFVGLIAFAVVFVWFRPDSLDRSAQIVAAIGVLMALWWSTEAIPLPVTALLPVIVFPVAGVMELKQSAAPYANPIIFLFLGGFLVALAIERCQLHRRIALLIFKSLGHSGAGLVGGFMLVAALLSMWISNTSTVLMMFPIALSLGMVVAESSTELADKEKHDFQIALLLGLAYGASMGGVATLVGTPTNAFMVGFLQTEYAIEIPFARWMMIGLPVTSVLLPIGWLLLTRVLFPVNFVSSEATRRELKHRYDSLGAMSTAEWRTAFVFVILVVGWVLRKYIAAWTGLEGLSDSGVAMAVALVAFVIPSGTDNQGSATLAGALEIAGLAPVGTNIVCMMPDTGERYL